jgi:hypothetical protein
MCPTIFRLKKVITSVTVFNLHQLELTSSATSALREEWTPMMKGVGVERTSTNAAGSSGMYTWV